MPIVSGNTSISGVYNISGSGSTYGISIDSTGRVRFPLTPAFRAYSAPGTAPNNFIVWRSANINQGSNYSLATGRFTAPISGHYQFMTGGIGNNAKTVYRYVFCKNGVENDFQHRLDTNGPDVSEYYGPNGCKTWMTWLNVNDYVQIKYKADNGTTTTYDQGTDDVFDFFIGYLVA